MSIPVHSQNVRCCGLLQHPKQPVLNYTILPQSSTHIRLVFRSWSVSHKYYTASLCSSLAFILHSYFVCVSVCLLSLFSVSFLFVILFLSFFLFCVCVCLTFSFLYFHNFGLLCLRSRCTSFCQVRWRLWLLV